MSDSPSRHRVCMRRVSCTCRGAWTSSTALAVLLLGLLGAGAWAPHAARAQGGALALDHFGAYAGSAPAPGGGLTIVVVNDPFGSTVTRLGPAEWLLVPTTDAQGVIGDPVGHLTCYGALDPLAGVGETVVAENRFGRQILTATAQEQVCVPSTRVALPGTTSLDPFVCYRVSGDPLHVPITTTDAFQTVSTTLVEPASFCTPASLNGGTIGQPDDDLLCFDYLVPGGGVGDVTVEHALEFMPVTISTTATSRLCVPTAGRVGAVGVPVLGLPGAVVLVSALLWGAACGRPSAALRGDRADGLDARAG